MNITTSLKPTLALVALLLAGQAAHAQHLNAGANAQTEGSQLVWANGAGFAASSGYVQNMALATSGRYAGLYNSGPTLTALSATNGGSALGSFLNAEIISVAGPAGATFSWWEGVDQGGGSSALFNILTGTSGSYLIPLSDPLGGAGQSGGDPFGHLHGRRFTATDLGTYTVGFRVLDTSTTGAGGGPWHTPSDVLLVNFVAVPEPSAFALAGLGLAGAWWLRRRKTS